MYCLIMYFIYAYLYIYILFASWIILENISSWNSPLFSKHLKNIRWLFLKPDTVSNAFFSQLLQISCSSRTYLLHWIFHSNIPINFGFSSATILIFFNNTLDFQQPHFGFSSTMLWIFFNNTLDFLQQLPNWT